jgi:hypothetical protein
MGLFDGLKNLFGAPKLDEIDNGGLIVDIDSIDEKEISVDEFVSYVKSEVERRRHERASMELQWLLNANFVSGHQYCEINPSMGTVEEIETEFDTEERGVYNRIAPIYDTRMANLRTVRYAMTVRPATAEDDDIEKAEISTELLRHTQRKLNWEEMKLRIYDWSELTGTAFVLSWWNPHKGDVVTENGCEAVDENGDVVREGDLDCGLLTPYEVFPESVYKETVAEQRSIIVEQVLHVDEIYERYGIRVNGGDCDKYIITPVSGGGGYGLNTFQSTVMATKTTKVHDSEKVITYYEAPTRKYKKGRVAVIIGDKLIHYGEMPFDSIPIIAVKCKTVAGQFFGKSVVQDLIPLQRAYNGCKNALHNYIKSAAGEALTVPEGCIDDIDEIITGGIAPNSIITYKPDAGSPSFLRRSGVPNEVINEMNQLVADMEYTAGISQLMIYGAAPSGVSSGKGIEQLREIDNVRLSLTAENMREAIRQLAITWLHIYKNFAKTYRVANIVGLNKAGSVLVWSGDEINSDDVIYDTVNELVLSEDAQRQSYLQALQMGLFADEKGVTPKEFREKAIEMMRLTPYSQMMTQADHQKANARRENDYLQAGVIPEIYEYDDDEIHIDEHIKFALQYKFKRFRVKSPALCEAFDKHIADHKARIEQRQNEAQMKAMALQASMQNSMTSGAHLLGHK